MSNPLSPTIKKALDAMSGAFLSLAYGFCRFLRVIYQLPLGVMLYS